VPELAEDLGNVPEAYKPRYISGPQCYECKKGFQRHGIEGFMDLPLVPKKSHPMTTPEEVQEKIVALSPLTGGGALEPATFSTTTIKEVYRRDRGAPTKCTKRRLRAQLRR